MPIDVWLSRAAACRRAIALPNPDAVRGGSSGRGSIDIASQRVAVLAGGVHEGEGERYEQTVALIDSVVGLGGSVVNDPLGKSVPDQMSDVRDSDATLIVAVGGDGTINAAASLAVRADVPVFIVPMGTMNLVAKDMGIPINPASVVERIDELTVISVDYASVNGEVFLHSALIGIVPEIARLREQIRAEDSALESFRHVFPLLHAALDSQTVSVQMRAEHGSHVQRTRSVAVTNNPLSENGVVTHARATVAAGELGVYASAHEGPLASVKLLASLGTGRLPKDPETLSTSCQRLVIEADVEQMSVSLDGEVRDLRLPLAFESHPRALRVAIPTAFIGEIAS